MGSVYSSSNFWKRLCKIDFIFFLNCFVEFINKTIWALEFIFLKILTTNLVLFNMYRTKVYLLLTCVSLVCIFQVIDSFHLNSMEIKLFIVLLCSSFSVCRVYKDILFHSWCSDLCFLSFYFYWFFFFLARSLKVNIFKGPGFVY